ncbi:hypothetical protein WME79_25090 [Sorangium sp. So ce726]|uniref:hypothetical protein n=1 Tax=Sorangium sp. So ce726 TaxID=3133319 RepID=UPI003F602200
MALLTQTSAFDKKNSLAMSNFFAALGQTRSRRPVGQTRNRRVACEGASGGSGSGQRAGR